MNMRTINSLEISKLSGQKNSLVVSLVENRIGKLPRIIIPAVTSRYKTVDVPIDVAIDVIMGSSKLELSRKLEIIGELMK